MGVLSVFMRVCVCGCVEAVGPAGRICCACGASFMAHSCVCVR